MSRQQPSVPEHRIRVVRESQIHSEGKYVLYVMTIFRRARHNFALQRAVEESARTGKPLLVLEPLRCGHRWNSARFHQFILNGMRDNQTAFRQPGVRYFPYLESSPGAGRGLVERLAEQAATVITDDFPGFFIPDWIRVLSRQINNRLEAVDSNGLFPIRLTPKAFSRAHFFRIFLQKNLAPYLHEFPMENPLDGHEFPDQLIDLDDVERYWPPANLNEKNLVQSLSIDQSVQPVSGMGGARKAATVLSEFIPKRLKHYAGERNHPEKDATSGLSPYLHFGHISPHEVFLRIMDSEDWHPGRIAEEPTKKVQKWWGVSESVEEFLDQLITWRELGLNMAWHEPGYDQYESLPEWAKKTLQEHESDPRDPCYTLEQFEASETADELWNAAQSQLVSEGRIHNYLRMLWGKKILHWSSSPQEALSIMIELNNKYALDGRDPNSYSGIFWILGRYDRAWGPERPIFGKIRYMASENTARKFRVKDYIRNQLDNANSLF